ncbi:hypothetical protein TNIN_285071 [Trichonephila inaurata madagascariensis]|uniref:Uncharacterized protein n=1 Tax=Trichonephila inaurata madagascariensis TaxID=2747483 RepID=A0A8X6X8S4_9ARAC|nr:hypothetical protein TNIN_285071 [Trichonephila inaurata madagascariensis]
MPFHILEHLFALDLIDLVMRRRCEKLPLKEQSFPFTQEIRNFVDAFLDREEMKINRIFTTVQGEQNVGNDTFPAFVESFRHNSFEFVDTFEDMLKYCITLCQLTSLVYRNGAQLAPSIALVEISDFVKAYLSTRSESTFWLKLGVKPELSIEQSTAFSAEVETADIQSAKGDKLQMLYNHLKKQTKKVVTV